MLTGPSSGNQNGHLSTGGQHEGQLRGQQLHEGQHGGQQLPDGQPYSLGYSSNPSSTLTTPTNTPGKGT